MNIDVRIRILAAVVTCLAATCAHAGAAQPSLEDRYIAARDAAIEKLQPIFDAGNERAEDADLAMEK
jgi:hypothetical protein